MKINEEIERAYGVNDPKEFWPVFKCSLKGPGMREDVPPVEAWTDYLKKGSQNTSGRRSQMS